MPFFIRQIATMNPMPPPQLRSLAKQRSLSPSGRMADNPSVPTPNGLSIDHEMAAALDRALDALERFQREAHATGRLRHPGIVQLFDYSRQGPPWFLVTEYVEGVEPRQWCRQCSSTPREVAALLACIADAVESAHQQGVWHRDL